MKSLVWSWILLLVCGVESSAGDGRPPVVLNAAVSEEVRFPVQIPDGFEIGDIIWLFKGGALAQLSASNELIEREKQFKGRVSINDQNASLHIWDLRKEDGGEYSVEMYQKGDPTEKEVRKYTLRIFNRVTAQVNISAVNGTCNITLNCTEKDGHNVSYTWRKKRDEKISIESIVNFNLSELDSKLEVCCQVKNPASTSKKCVVPWQESIEGFNHSNCKSSSERDGSYDAVYAVVGSIVGVGSIGGVAFAVKKGNKRQKDPKDKNDVQTVYATVNKPKNATQEENRHQYTEEPYEMERVQTVYAEVQNTQQGEASPDSANNLSSSEDIRMELYDEVQHPKVGALPAPAINPSTSKEDTGNTVYDKVQRPKNKRDEKKKLLDENPAPPYDQIIRGNNAPAE